MKMNEYFKEYKLVEVQKTFYDPRGLSTFKKWREKAPKDFEFTMKAWQGLTHSIKSPTWRRYKGELIGNKDNFGMLRYTEEVLWAWEQTIKAAEMLEADKIVIQLPPSLDWNKYKDDILKTLNKLVESNKRLIIEPRHKSWFNDEVYKLFRKYNIVFCTDPFKNGIIKTVDDLIYIRLHGIGGYKYKYSDDELMKIFDWIRDYSESMNIYILFNNVYMLDDSRRFIRKFIS